MSSRQFSCHLIAGTSGKAKVFTVTPNSDIKTNSRRVTEVQIHPGGGTHGDSPYYKFTIQPENERKIEVRIVENLDKFDPGTVGTRQFYYNRYGQRIQWNESIKSWENIDK